MKYTVVIVTYNRLGLLKECLQCIENQVLGFDNVVIVDNKSTDGTSEYLKKYVDKYDVLFEEVNGGGAKGFKDGVEYAYNNLETDYILLIDDDAMLSTDYLQLIDYAIKNNPDCYAFSGTVITDEKIDLTHRKRLSKGLRFDMVPIPVHQYNADSFEYDLSTFCGLFFKKDLIKHIGFPKDEYFIWFDDTEYSLRIRRHTKIMNINKAVINHKTKLPSPNSPLSWKGYYGIRNNGDVIMRYGTRINLLFFKLTVYRACLKEYICFLFTNDVKFKYNSKLYVNALRDLKNKKFGFNTQYHP